MNQNNTIYRNDIQRRYTSQMKQMIFYFTMSVLLFICSCRSKPQSNNHASIDNLIVGKWQMVEYGNGCVNALNTISFYENGKMDYPFEAGEFTYRFIASDSLAIYNHGFGEQHYKILKLSNDSLIGQIKRQRVYADSIDEPLHGEVEKYIRVTNV